MKQAVNDRKVELRERVKEDLLRELEWKNDGEVCYLEGFDHKDCELMDYSPDEWIEKSFDDDSGNIILALYLDDIHIGSAGFFPEDNDVGEVGMLIGERKYRGKGHGSEALGLFVNYLFKEKNIKKVYAYVQGFNKRALGVARNAGFVEKKRVERFSEKFGCYEEVYLEAEKLSVSKGI